MNDQPKPKSVEYRRRLQERVARLGVPHAQIAAHVVAELLQTGQVRPREAWRLASDFSRDAVAERFNEVSGDPQSAMRGSRIAEYERWPGSKARPTVRVLRILAQVYGCRWTQLLDLDDLEHMPEVDRKLYCEALDAPEPVRSIELAPSVSKPRPVDQEGWLMQTSAQSMFLANRTTTTNVDDFMLATLSAELHQISRAYLHASPHPLFLRMMKLRNQVAQLLEGRQRPIQTRDLIVLSAQSCALLAWMSEDLGNHVAAAEHAEASWINAQHADHHGAIRWAKAMQSRGAFWAGDFILSAQLAAEGLSYGADDNVGAFLTLLEARAWAAAGRELEATRALGAWEDERAKEPCVESADGLFDLKQDRQAYLAGNTLLSLKKEEEAFSELERSLSLHEQLPPEKRFYGAAMLGRIDESQVFLKSGDLEAAARTLEPIFEIDASHRLRMVVLSLKKVQKSLKSYPYQSSNKAKGLSTHIAGYCSAAISRQDGV